MHRQHVPIVSMATFRRRDGFGRNLLQRRSQKNKNKLLSITDVANAARRATVPSSAAGAASAFVGAAQVLMSTQKRAQTGTTKYNQVTWLDERRQANRCRAGRGGLRGAREQRIATP